jgi:diacylglycerol kinase (ATP)
LEAFEGADADISLVEHLDDDTTFTAALVFGGDGTIHRHLRPLIERKIPLLPVPVGSGNDFAAALGIGTVRDALSAWQAFCSGAANVREMDVGLIRAGQKLETYFCNIAGLGLDSEANRLANAMPRWLRRHGGYILAALRAIVSFRPAVVTIDNGNQAGPSIAQPAMLVAIANTTSYGGGMRIAPRAQLADGLLDVCVVRRVGRGRLLRSFPRVFRGEHLAMPEVEYFQSASLRIAAERPLEVYADGEFICQTPCEISAVPRALRVIVPSAQRDDEQYRC